MMDLISCATGEARSMDDAHAFAAKCVTGRGRAEGGGRGASAAALLWGRAPLPACRASHAHAGTCACVRAEVLHRSSPSWHGMACMWTCTCAPACLRCCLACRGNVWRLGRRGLEPPVEGSLIQSARYALLMHAFGCMDALMHPLHFHPSKCMAGMGGLHAEGLLVAHALHAS